MHQTVAKYAVVELIWVKSSISLEGEQSKWNKKLYKLLKIFGSISYQPNASLQCCEIIIRVSEMGLDLSLGLG